MALPPIPVGLQCIDWRYDEITGTFNFQEITSEVHSVQIIPEYAGRRGFKLFERPVDNSTLLIYQGNTDAHKVPENRQSRVATAPTGSQVYVSPRIALVVVPDTVPIGSQYIVSYFGVGSVKNVQNDLYIEQLALAEKLSRDGSLPMLGNLNANLNKIINLAAGTNPNDSVRLSQLTTVINNLAAEVTARTNADNSINGQLSPLANLVKWVEASVNVRDYANDPNGGPSGKLGMEAYAPRRGTLFWRNSRANISGCGSYGSGSTPFQVIDTGSQFEFRWTSPSNALMEWMLLKW
ncbi:hypothetical protein [Leptospira interrogans]|uniref:hypothetical protein n=1 Tax=Leptospira interrogans TaxID=173 RepID=UPI0002B953A3|nr:hypothetical protein [Leptospira interrogans]QOI36753.1 hypothetical protein LeptoLang_21410 [Leptospira interrogans serovar Icterohaemorrhagiae]